MHKSTPKILSTLFLVFFLGMLLLPLFFEPANAAEPYNLKQPIGNVTSLTFDGSTRPIAQYIEGIYKYSIGIVAILATVVMMIGGLVWMTAAGSQTRISEAKQYITGALTGMVLVLCSYMILNTINPDLVNIKPVKIKTVEEIKKEETITGPLKDGGSACCKSPEDCEQGYTCNLSMMTGQCYGVCVAVSGLSVNMVCDPERTDQCESGLICIAPTGTNSGRCQEPETPCGTTEDQGICIERIGSILNPCGSEKEWIMSGESCPGGLWCCKNINETNLPIGSTTNPDTYPCSTYCPSGECEYIPGEEGYYDVYCN